MSINSLEANKSNIDTVLNSIDVLSNSINNKFEHQENQIKNQAEIIEGLQLNLEKMQSEAAVRVLERPEAKETIGGMLDLSKFNNLNEADKKKYLNSLHNKSGGGQEIPFNLQGVSNGVNNVLRVVDNEGQVVGNGTIITQTNNCASRSVDLLDILNIDFMDCKDKSSFFQVLSAAITDKEGVKVVKEGELKPEINIIFEHQAVKPVKVAGHFSVTDELTCWDDVISLLINTAQVSLRNELINALLYGKRVKDYGFDGYMQIAHSIGDYQEFLKLDPTMNKLDILKLVILFLYKKSGGLSADALVMSPFTWSEITMLKDKSGAHILPQDLKNLDFWLFGLQVVFDLNMPIGEVLVGSFKCASHVKMLKNNVLRSSNEHCDNFVKNITTYLLENYIGLGVKNPHVFARVNLGEPVWGSLLLGK